MSARKAFIIFLCLPSTQNKTRLWYCRSDKGAVHHTACLLKLTYFTIHRFKLHPMSCMIQLLKDWNTKAQFDLISFSKLMAPVMSWMIVYIVSQIVLYLFIFISYYMFSSKAFKLCFQIHQNDLLYYYIYLDNWYTTTHL